MYIATHNYQGRFSYGTGSAPCSALAGCILAAVHLLSPEVPGQIFGEIHRFNLSRKTGPRGVEHEVTLFAEIPPLTKAARTTAPRRRLATRSYLYRNLVTEAARRAVVENGYG
jgi:hypothetical protein